MDPTTTAAAGTMTAIAGTTIIVQDDDTETNAAIAALIIAGIAFFAAVAQLTQSIIAAARGLPNCSSDVMGNWAQTTSRKFKWSEFRLQVYFESPVIFLAHYQNDRFPMPDAKKYFANGSDDSRGQFRLDPKPALPAKTSSSSTVSSGKQANGLSHRHARPQERTHNVNNERVSWLKLLETIQKMEDMSSIWEREQDLSDVSTGHVDLVVWMQPKKRSFDANPAVKKPYANTTICHIVELAAMLGLHWKLFDRDANRYRAEGNGSSLLGTRVDELGIVFVFEAIGHPKFDQNRVIPTSALKELCFGNVPTFFRSTKAADDIEIRQGPLPEQDELLTLQLGSRQEIAQTLNLIGCNTTTRLYYLREKNDIHLFPVTFEILGMLGRTLHLTGRPFTYLPNPTIFEWNRRSFSMRRMLKHFLKSLDDAIGAFQVTVPGELSQVRNYAAELVRTIPEEEKESLRPKDLELLHHSLDSLDQLLLEKDKEVVLDVLRRHLQEVLLAVNTPAEGGGSDASSTAAAPSTRSARETISFDNLLDVPPEYREKEFMAKYFEEVRYRVISNTDDDAYGNNQATEASRAIQGRSDKERAQRREYHRQSFQAASIRSMPLSPRTADAPADAQAQAAPARRSLDAPPMGRPPPPPMTGASTPEAGTRTPVEDPAADPTPYQDHQQGSVQHHHHETSPKILTTQPTFHQPDFGGGDGGSAHPGKPHRPPRDADEVHRNSIWCMLVLRMTCWLLLHNFDKNDVQLPKSGLVGNRQPVYIM